MIISLPTNSPQETRQVASLLGANMPPGTVIAATGNLGLGKTVFAQGLAQGLDIKGPVTSPTFTYIQEYRGRLPFCHIDAYRLEGQEEEELAQIGLSDCFARHNTAYVEWPEFIRPFLPADRIELQFQPIPGDAQGRMLLFSYNEAANPWLTPLLQP